MKCPECGGNVRNFAAAGRVTRYKNIPNLEIPSDLEIPTCDRCGEEFADEDVAAAFDKALEPVYLARMQHIAREAILLMNGVTSQRDLEWLLNLGQGYLTKLKSGRRTPSAELALNLAAIALDPTERLKELRIILGSGVADARQYVRNRIEKQVVYYKANRKPEFEQYEQDTLATDQQVTKRPTTRPPIIWQEASVASQFQAIA